MLGLSFSFTFDWVKVLRKVQPWFIPRNFFLLKLCFVLVDLRSNYVWNNVAFFGQVFTWICWVSYRNKYYGSFGSFTDHSSSTYAKFSKKLTFHTPWYTHVRMHIRVYRICIRCFLELWHCHWNVASSGPLHRYDIERCVPLDWQYCFLW